MPRRSNARRRARDGCGGRRGRARTVEAAPRSEESPLTADGTAPAAAGAPSEAADPPLVGTASSGTEPALADS